MTKKEEKTESHKPAAVVEGGAVQAGAAAGAHGGTLGDLAGAGGAGKGCAIDFVLNKLHLTTDVPVDILAWALDLTPMRVQQLVTDGVLAKTGRGQYPLVPNIHAYLAYIRARLPGPRARGDVPVGDGDTIDSAVERAKLARSQRLMIDLRRAERARCLLPIEDAEREFGKVISMVQTKIRALPSKAAPLLVGQEVQEVQVLLDQMVEEALLELANPPNLEPPTLDVEDVVMLDDGEVFE